MAKLTKNQVRLIYELVNISAIVNGDWIEHDSSKHEKNVWDCDCFLARETRINIDRTHAIKLELGLGTI